MTLYNYDFKKIVCVVGVAPIQGYADGTGIDLEMDGDLFQKYIGADGDVSRSRLQGGLSASIKLTLAQTSPSNNILSALALLDITSNAGVVPLILKDVLGDTKILSGYCWVKKLTGVSFGKEIGTREWLLDIATLEYFVGGNAAVLG